MHRFLDLNVFEVLLTHNRYTLVDRSADELITRAADAGLGVVNAAYLGGGMLADPHGAPNTATAPPRRRPRPPLSPRRPVPGVGTDLATAALHFSLRDPRIHTSVVGISKSERLDSLAESLAVNLPQEFWDAAETLLPDPSNWLEPPT